jgi:hypothetical protein
MPKIPNFTSSRTSVSLNSDFIICHVLIIVPLFIEFKICYEFWFIEVLYKKKETLGLLLRFLFNP